MVYLNWAAEEWAFTEEDKTVQTEYEQIINDAQLFEVHSSGLLYADYVDADGDGKAELLTIGTPGDASGHHSYEVTATVYANIDGHAGKLCEQTFLWEWDEESLSICTNDNRVCLWNTWLHMGTASEGDVFYKIENGAFVINESVSVSYASEKPEYEGITEAEYNALDQKYTGRKELLSYNRNSGISVHDRGPLPTADEYWDNYWMSQPMYAAVLNGDFSFFAGTYDFVSCDIPDMPADPLVLKDNGAVLGGNFLFTIGQKPISVTVANNGTIRCTISSKSPSGTVDHNDGGEEYYEIYPVDVNPDYGGNDSLDKVRIYYVYAYGGVGSWRFTKVS